jgi:hypothetical protein
MEKMVEEGNTVARGESKPVRVVSEVVHHGSRVVELAVEHLDRDLRHHPGAVKVVWPDGDPVARS